MIQSTSNITGYYRVESLSSQPGQKPSAASVQKDVGDNLSSSGTDSLRSALAQTQEIRPEIVARGKALAVDPNYPPRELIASLSKLMIESRDPSATS
jgi:hypothetical protein